ncbi:2,4-dienoyl-CoA reductase-like NADH-dependent reductase (Old Yellow Enzyme family) [Kineothrix alysoides]|uniref:2,4-dienoyl-CoA reductase-like NADH-dependent reductase (Old Yellow Enzyme family) n=1 Tax=Kineothrix alysoides TaxID=1469948 RepID=A0A4R1QXD5_9FIRM|nr:NADH:flavin oxidoreductase [Kineothrix alysoides]TCL56294.1 2,4-dienoyl-CoA reductase-like NADH-dependent reductase (Old Yellow Enzyme family) [Kineothrix alysoides]
MNHLFTPVRIKNITVKNRIAVPPMVVFTWADDTGRATQKHVEHYEAIAKGGAGLIIQEATCVNKNGRLADTQLGIWEDGQMEGLKKITEAVHRHETPILVQIHHAGVVGFAEKVVCPGDYEYMVKGQLKKVHKLTIEELHAIQQDFVTAARRASLAGYDGVELHACHSYLISQFLNRGVNHRDDRYGQEPELFALEIIREIRRQTPPDFIIGIRLGGFEPALEDGIAFARIFEESGVDFLDVSYGFVQETTPVVPKDYPFKDIIYAAQKMKEAVSIPVFAVNGINNPELADKILEQTNVDMVDIGRGTLVNYNWANDAKEGRDVGTCLYCKTCMWRVDPMKCPGKQKHQRNHPSMNAFYENNMKSPLSGKVVKN